MIQLIRKIIFIFIVKPLALIIIGVNIRNKEKFPKKGPAIIVANHNSHLDTVVIMSLFSLKVFSSVKPIAAADYFLRNKVLSWLALNIIGIVPISRNVTSLNRDPLSNVSEALSKGNIIIFFPEGTRGEPEKLEEFKSGIAHISKRHPDIPITPIFLYGLGKSLPKGEALLVPFICDLFIGKELFWNNDKEKFMEDLNNEFLELKTKSNYNEW